MVCQSKASLGALVLFILLDNLIPKKFLKNNIVLIACFALMFVLGPFVFYWFAKSDAMNLFTGREAIWAEFFEKWFSNSRNMLIGMEPFTASWKSLGTHNSFIYVLGNYGVIGYSLLFGTFLYLFSANFINKTKLSPLQVSLFIGFLAICVQGTMEDTLLANYWMPIVYAFVGIALQKTEQTIEK